MIRKVRARFANGVLTPLEPPTLEEGSEVALSLEADLPKLNCPSFSSTIPAQRPLRGSPRRKISNTV